MDYSQFLTRTSGTPAKRPLRGAAAAAAARRRSTQGTSRGRANTARSTAAASSITAGQFAGGGDPMQLIPHLLNVIGTSCEAVNALWQGPGADQVVQQVATAAFNKRNR